MRSRSILTVCAAILLVVSLAAVAGASGRQAAPAPDELSFPHVEGELIVGYSVEALAADRSAARATIGAALKRRMLVPGAEVLQLNPGRRPADALAAARRLPTVAWAQPNYIRTADATPNDPHFGLEWGLHNTGQTVNGTTGTADADIDATEAWDIHTGGSGAVVAIVDTGVNASHEDLSANMWTNPGETGTSGGGDKRFNGIDDDGNGFIDDYRGWDFIAADNNPNDEHSHGTHVAGTVAAKGNNGIGITGVSWGARLMALRSLDENGSGSDSQIADAFTYAANNGAHIVNASLGGPGSSSVMTTAIQNAPNTLFVVAAGNGGLDGVGDNNDGVGGAQAPCNINTSNLICVAATNSNDQLAGFSNYGSTSVDLAAPGVNIASTYPFSGGGTPCNNCYAYLNGTSMATPHVAGVAALVKSKTPSTTVSGLRSALLNTVDAKSSLSGKVVTGGRLNANKALTGGGGSPSPSPSPSPSTSPSPSPTPTPGPNPISFDASSYSFRDLPLITVQDAGANVSGSPDTITVNVSSNTVPGGIGLDLTETGPATGVFSGDLLIGARVTSAPDGVVKAREGDVLTVSYNTISAQAAVSDGASVATVFTDDGASIHQDNINALWGAAVTGGCTATEFCPKEIVARWQMAVFLKNALDLPPATKDYFSDDNSLSPGFEDAINRLAEAGIAGGCAKGKFCPKNGVTRAEMATFLVRGYGFGPPSGVDHFDDDDTVVHQPNINALKEAGITGGCGGTNYCPNSNVSREQMATFLAKAGDFF